MTKKAMIKFATEQLKIFSKDSDMGIFLLSVIALLNHEMKDLIKYDIGNQVNVEILHHGTKQVMKGTISMITITKSKIKYRAKFGYDEQCDFLQEEIIDN